MFIWQNNSLFFLLGLTNFPDVGFLKIGFPVTDVNSFPVEQASKQMRKLLVSSTVDLALSE